MVIVMAMVMVVNKEATFQGDYQCCGDNDDGDDLDVFLRRHSDGDRHGNGDGDDDDGGDDDADDDFSRRVAGLSPPVTLGTPPSRPRELPHKASQ